MNGSYTLVSTAELSSYASIPPSLSCNLTNKSTGSSGGKVAGNDVIVLLWEICGPILLLIGLVGNILVLVTMTRRRMRGTSASVYLIGMAALDLIVLVVGLTPAWLEGSNYVVIKDLHPAACKLQKFLDYTSGDSAVWLRMAFTIDRLIAVLLPLYTGNCCGRTESARIYIAIACSVAVAKDMHVFWTRGAQYRAVHTCLDNGTLYSEGLELASVCGYPTAAYQNFELYVRPWIAFAVVSVLPFIVIAVCNAMIIGALVMRRRRMSGTIGRQSLSAHTVRTSRTDRRRSSAPSVAGGSSGNGNGNIGRKPAQRNSSHEQQFFQMAAMCIAASGLFLVCTAPNIVILIGKPYWNVPSGGNAAFEIARAVCNIMYYVTFSANFFLYCWTGKRFRTTLIGLFQGSCRSARSSLSSVYGTVKNVRNSQSTTTSKTRESRTSTTSGGSSTPRRPPSDDSRSRTSATVNGRSGFNRQISNELAEMNGGNRPRTDVTSRQAETQLGSSVVGVGLDVGLVLTAVASDKTDNSSDPLTTEDNVPSFVSYDADSRIVNRQSRFPIELSDKLNVELSSSGQCRDTEAQPPSNSVTQPPSDSSCQETTTKNPALLKPLDLSSVEFSSNVVAVHQRSDVTDYLPQRFDQRLDASVSAAARQLSDEQATGNTSDRYNPEASEPAKRVVIRRRSTDCSTGTSSEDTSLNDVFSQALKCFSGFQLRNRRPKSVELTSSEQDKDDDCSSTVQYKMLEITSSVDV